MKPGKRIDSLLGQLTGFAGLPSAASKGSRHSSGFRPHVRVSSWKSKGLKTV